MVLELMLVSLCCWSLKNPIPVITLMTYEAKRISQSKYMLPYTIGLLLTEPKIC